MPLSLATLYDQPPAGGEWLHEIKYDGYRMEARLDNGDVRLLTRKGLQDWTHRFEPIAEAVSRLPAAHCAPRRRNCCWRIARGISDFSLLQTDLRNGRTDRFIYYVFDLLHLDGRDLLNEALLCAQGRISRLGESRRRKWGYPRYAESFEEKRARYPSPRLRDGT